LREIRSQECRGEKEERGGEKRGVKGESEGNGMWDFRKRKGFGEAVERELWR
jgi:hypothetical protein